MSWREQPRRCFEESQRHGSRATLAFPTGMTTPVPPQMQESSTTLDVHTRRGWQKVVAPCEDDLGPQSFFTSGKTVQTVDGKGGMFMVDNMPEPEDAEADFNIVFKRNVTLSGRTFEDNAHWRPKGKRGEGVSGSVTAHEDTTTNVSFVRKKIKKGTKLRREELKAMLAVNHPGICSLYGLMVHDGAVDILMQDAGAPLRDFLRHIAQKGIRADRYWTVIKDFTLQGFRAIQEMHKSSVFHLDIKPENFLANMDMNHQPLLVLADFGSALIGSQQMDLRLQLTPEYMAPEVWHIYRRKGRSSCGPQDQVQPAFDVYAFGLTVYFMCAQRHLLLEVLKEKDKLIDPCKVQAFTNGKLDPVFGFKFLLMTEYAYLIPHLASMGPWVFPSQPPPDELIEVIKRTLDPNPETRWTEQDVISFLTGEVAEEADTFEVQEEDVFKTPTQATDTGSYHYGEQSCVDDMDQVLNLRGETGAAAPVPVQTPVFQYEDADVRSYGSQLLPQEYRLPPAAAAVAGDFTRPAQVSQEVEVDLERDMQVGGQRAQPMQLNSDVIMLGEEEPAQACAMAVEKPDFDMDMHLRVTYRQADVPDPQPPPDQFGVEDLKKAFKEAGLGGPSQVRGPPFDFKFNGRDVAGPPDLQLLGVISKQRALGPVSVQPPPDITTLSKGGSIRPPARPGGKKGKQVMMGDQSRGVTTVPMKASNPTHGKHAAFMSQGKKMLIAEDVAAQPRPPIPFFVASSNRPGLAARVIPPPSFATAAPGTGGFVNGFGQSFQGQSAARSATSPASANETMTPNQLGTFTPFQPPSFKKAAGPKFVSPWTVAEPVGNPAARLESIQPTSPGALAVGDSTKLSQQGAKALGINMPKFDLLM